MIIDTAMITLRDDWREQGLSKQLYAFMEKWEEIAWKERKNFRSEWPDKKIRIRFRENSKYYQIVPETFGIPDDLFELLQQGPWVTEKYGRGMNEELQEALGGTSIDFGTD